MSVRVIAAAPTADISDDEYRALRELWLSRLMFNEFVGWPPETRTLEEFIAAAAPTRPGASQ